MFLWLVLIGYDVLSTEDSITWHDIGFKDILLVGSHRV